MLGRLLALGALWLILADGDAATWRAGLIGVAIALATAARLGTPRWPRLRWLAALGFVPFFFWQSVRGGLDVAGRVLRPALRIDPLVFTHRLSLRDPVARVAFLNALSLLPGTLAADLEGDTLSVHALDPAAGRGPVGELERRMARAFGEEVADV